MERWTRAVIATSSPGSSSSCVTLIGLAIDYSMLVVFRYREELDKGEAPHEALVVTMKTAGRATLFSGATVAVGLALLVFMPLPFMRSMGVGGLLVPLFSILASATFLPALLAVMGTKVNRLRIIPRSILEHRASGRTGGPRLAHPTFTPLWGGRCGLRRRAAAKPPLGEDRSFGHRAGFERRSTPPPSFSLILSTAISTAATA